MIDGQGPETGYDWRSERKAGFHDPSTHTDVN